eukprot:SAG22_NODE_109_length_19706_cov_464.723772_2_plen_101_part_00
MLLRLPRLLRLLWQLLRLLLPLLPLPPPQLVGHLGQLVLELIVVVVVGRRGRRRPPLLFNVKTSNVGFLIAELRGPDGTALAGFSLDDAVPIRGNSLRRG